MYFFDIRFLSCADDVHVKNTDLKAYKYEKKNQTECALSTGKRSYCERRGQSWTASGKRPARLRATLRELEECLQEDRTLLCRWRSPSLLCIIFSSGLISYVAINPRTAAVTRIFFDRYCVGKIPANAAGVIFTDTNLLFTFAENFTILITFNPPSSPAGLEKINSRDPKYQTIELYGPTRKSEKRMSVRTGSEGGTDAPQATRVLVWSASAAGELFPWSPAVRGEDRANVHVYTLNKTQMTLLCYHRVDSEALSVELSQLHNNTVYTIDQKTYKKGGLSVECCSYEMEGGALRLRACSAVSVPAPARAAQRSPCEARVLLACIDATLLVHHEAHRVTRSVKADFIPSVVRWAEGLVVVCEERGRLQCFDLSLTPLPASASHEDAKFIDIGAHLKRQCTVVGVEWNSERGGGDTCPQLVVCFEGGPLALLHLTLTDIIRRWLSEGHVSRATSLLRSLSWDTEGDTCLHILHSTVKHLFRKPLSPSSELLLQEALGSFHMPSFPLAESAVAEYGAPVHDLTRKFFHHLVRYGRLDKALSLAVDLGDSDLYMDVAYAAQRLGNTDLAQEAHQHAVGAISEHSTCSMSCCSQCSSDSRSDCGSLSEDQAPVVNHDKDKLKLQLHRAAPPLPYLPPPVSTSEPPLPVSVVPPDPAPVHSIRPNIHQYIERDSTLWHEVKQHDLTHYKKYEKKPMHKVVDIIPRPSDESAVSMHYNSIYQTELREETNGSTSWQQLQVEKRPYMSVYSQKSAMANRYPPSDIGSAISLSFDKSLSTSRASGLLMDQKVSSSKPPGERNKVKFSDTVTVAVVPEIPRKEKITGNISLECGSRVMDPRKELADSLPLCHPNHDYLRDFAPVTNDNDTNESQGKIKVVHFGMV